MGSPQYGRLVLDGHVISGSRQIEAKSLRWSAGGRRLAAQELVSWPDAPVTRVVVFDTEQRIRLAASPARRGISTPVKFEHGALVYRHWDERTGNHEMRLQMENE